MKNHHPDMESVLTQIRAGFGRVKDVTEASVEGDLKGTAYLSLVRHLAAKFNEACAELAEHLDAKERAA